jgi:hypothetical protein
MNVGTRYFSIFLPLLLYCLTAGHIKTDCYAAAIEYKQTMVRVLQESDVQGWPGGGYETSGRHTESVAVSANGAKVGFVVKLNVYSDRHIYVMNGDGTGLVDLTGNVPAGAAFGTLQLNDDGSRLFFWDYGAGNIYYFDTSPPYACHAAYKPDAFWIGSTRSYGLNSAGTVIYLKHFWNVGDISHYGLVSTVVGTNVLTPVVDVLNLTPPKTVDYSLDFLDAARSGGRLLLTYYPDYWHDRDKVMWETGPLQPMPNESHYGIWDNNTSLQWCHIMTSDGGKALYLFMDTDSKPELHILNLNTGSKSLLVQLDSGLDNLQYPALSPDGSIARWGSYGYYYTRRVIATGEMRDTFSYWFPEAGAIGYGNPTDITANNRYYYLGASDPAGKSCIHRIDMAPASTAPASDITSITFGQPQLIYRDSTPVTVTVNVSDTNGVDNILSVKMHTLVDGREYHPGQVYEPLVYYAPLTNNGGGVYTGTIYPDTNCSFYTTYTLPKPVGVRIVVRNKDEHYTIADTSITVLPPVLNPVTTPTNESSQTIGGYIAAGSPVTVSLNGGTAQPATVIGNNWSYTLTGLVWGNNVVIVTATDPLGHTKVITVTITRKPKLTVTIPGGVGGSVTSDTGGITCPAGPCSALYNLNTAVRLTANTDTNYVFGGWSGAGTGTGNTRDINMDNDKGVTATFYVPLAKILETGIGYPFIHDAYAVVNPGETIQAREHEFIEDLTLNRGIPLILKGGYDITYSGNSGYSTIDGTVTVGTGALTLEGIIVK